MQLKFIDYIYILLSCTAGIWQAWCVSYGRNSILLLMLMSLPFTLLSWGHLSLYSQNRRALGGPGWKRLLVLWAGMPFSLAIGALTIFVATRMMYAAGFGAENPPFYFLRLAIGEAAACGVWIACLVAWPSQSHVGLSHKLFLSFFAILFACILAANGISNLVVKSFHKDIYLLLTSTVATTISSLLLILLKSKAEQIGGINAAEA